MNKDNVQKYLEVIKRSVQLIEQEMGGASMPTISSPALIDGVKPLQDETVVLARKKHVEELMAIDSWPCAVEDYLRASATKEDQINRANAVLDMMLDRSVENFEFLDFGTGDGWIARQALARGVNSSTGYDIKESPNWVNIDNVEFTTKYEDLKTNFYDAIILFDVLDHCEDPVGLMQQVKDLLKLGGVVYVRCHPWTSKHATHAYKQGLNKSFVHLFLTWEEINELVDGEPMFTRVEKNPIEAYHWWFHDFNIIKESRVDNEALNNFFLVPSFKNLIKNEQQLSDVDMDRFFKDMEIQFVDFILEK